jgi:hypothetical protein
MDDLMSYYKKQVSAMCRRVITPWDEYPNKVYLEELAEIPDTEESIEIPARKSKSKKRRSRNKSTSEELDKSYPSYSRQQQVSISSDVSIKSDDDVTEIDIASSPVDDVTFMVCGVLIYSQTCFSDQLYYVILISISFHSAYHI